MVAERFNQRVNIQPVSAQTGAAQAALSLADRLEQFKTLSLGVAETAATTRGQLSGAQVPLTKGPKGITQKPEFKEVGIFGRVEALAHNKALQAGYLASIDTDIKTNISKIETDNPDDILKFNEAAQGFRKGLIQSVEPSIRNAVINQFDNRLITANARVQKATIRKQNILAQSSLKVNEDLLFSDATSAARNGEVQQAALSMLDYFKNIDSQVAAGFLTVDQASTKKREVEREASEQTFRRELDLLSDGNFKQAFDRIEELNKKVPKGWEPDEWRTFITSAQQEINRKQQRAKEEIKVLTKEAEIQESVDRGISFTNPAIPADPAKGSQDRKDVNNAYDVVSKEWVELPPVEQFEKNIEFIKNTGMFPDKMISGINATMRSGTPDQVFVFSGLLNSVAADPVTANILSDIPDESRSMAKQIADSLDSGIEIEVATEIARKTVYGLTQSDKERIKIETNAIRQDLPGMLEDLVDKEFDPSIIPFFGEEPDVNPAIQADFNVAFDKFMVLSDGDARQAGTLAFDSLKKVWGVNDIDGDKRFMKYAPSVFYSVPGVDDGWMEDQYETDMKSLGFKVKDTIIATDFDTTNSETPTWPIMTVDKEGRFLPLFDNEGVALRWQPDFKSTKEFVKLRGLPEKRTQKAINLRNKVEKFNELFLNLEPGGV